MEEIIVTINGKEYKVRIEETVDGKILVHYGHEVYEVKTRPKESRDVEEIVRRQKGKKTSRDAVTAPLPGTVYNLHVKVGDMVKEGDTLLTLIAMKMENDVTASRDGIVKEIKVKKNDTVQRGDILMILE